MCPVCVTVWQRWSPRLRLLEVLLWYWLMCSGGARCFGVRAVDISDWIKVRAVNLSDILMMAGWAATIIDAAIWLAIAICIKRRRRARK